MAHTDGDAAEQGGDTLDQSTGRIVILLRHGKSDYPGGVDDHDRPLAPRGRREAALAGEWLRAGSWDPSGDGTIDQVRCSSATRARETLERTGIDAPTSYTDEIYEATADEIVAMLRRVHSGVRTLLVVGHGPGLPDTALELAGPGSDADALDAVQRGFPTSAMAVIDVPDTWAEIDPDTTALRLFHVPRE
jgi:phosphohistidine phosphatase